MDTERERKDTTNNLSKLLGVNPYSKREKILSLLGYG